MRTTVGIPCLALALAAGCGRTETPAGQAMRLPVNVFADTGRTMTLNVPDSMAAPSRPSRPAVWMARVSPAPPASQPPLPAPAPAPVPESAEREPAIPAPPALELDGGLEPPVLLAPGTLRVPPGAGPAFVELDVLVDEDGDVARALWAGGSRDTALVRAALECARSMRYTPARRGGRPAAVWCRQRVDVGGESAHTLPSTTKRR